MKDNSKSFKIVSRFYVIYGDGVPIYVGYTNRTVKQRFTEHKHDKDFSEYNSVESIELKDQRMSFDFTWDYNKTCENANGVSKREEYLVNKYHTQDTCYQKAIGGGQTWTSEKGFVRSNKDNPKFKGMPASEIKKYLDSQKTQEIWLHNFINDMRPIQEDWLRNFINDMRPVQEVWLHNFVIHMKPVQEVWLSSFVGSMKPTQEVWLDSFVTSMKPTQEVWLDSFVTNMKPTQEVWLESFINHMEPIQEMWLHNFINNMTTKKKS